jgi:hypothetical protein
MAQRRIPVRVWIAATGSYCRSDGRFVKATEREDESTEALAGLGITDVIYGRVFKENWGKEVSFPTLETAVETAICDFAPTALTYADRNGIMTYDAKLTFSAYQGDDELTIYLC